MKRLSRWEGVYIAVYFSEMGSFFTRLVIYGLAIAGLLILLAACTKPIYVCKAVEANSGNMYLACYPYEAPKE